MRKLRYDVSFPHSQSWYLVEPNMVPGLLVGFHDTVIISIILEKSLIDYGR